MRYHDITKCDMKNGDGLRVVLWLAGCPHHCHGCHNPETWDAGGGIPFDEAAKQELFEALDKDYIHGITFSGGDPLCEDNYEETLALMKEVTERFPDKTVWCYTGYTWEEMKHLPVMHFIDVLVDGPYEESLRDTELMWRGSSNQRVIDVTRSLLERKVILHCGDHFKSHKVQPPCSCCS